MRGRAYRRLETAKKNGKLCAPVICAAHQFDENSPELQQVLEAVRTYTKK